MFRATLRLQGANLKHVSTLFIAAVLALLFCVERTSSATTAMTTLRVEGMTCEDCAPAVRRVALQAAGVITAAVSYEESSAAITYDPAKTSPDAIARSIATTLGYKVSVALPGQSAPRTASVVTKNACRTTPAAVPGQTLPPYRIDELRDRFNAASDRVRVVALLSPTCGECRRGQRVVQSVFQALEGERRLEGFVIWLPMLKTNDSRAAASQAEEFSDARLVQRWDGERSSGEMLATALHLKRTAWDVYLIYPAGVRWDGNSIPQPAFWMHQLTSDSGADPKACLDPAAFLNQVKRALAKS